MKKTLALLCLSCSCLLAASAGAQTDAGLSPAEILKPVPGTWPTYSGDYSSRRYSPLKQVNQSNVKNLSLAFIARLTGGPVGATVGGEGPLPSGPQPAPAIRGATLQVDGILYTSAPDNAWAIDGRTGQVLWHYFWKTRGGTHIGNRGLGMWGHYLYLETPDNYLISLDARTGHERWHVPIASLEEQYFSTAAPVVVGNHVLVGTGNDLDAPGFLTSFDPETGAVQWKHYMIPMNPGDPGLETWKDLDAARHGGGNAWVPGSYDPQTHLYIVGTGNPTPSYFADPRGNGDALFTCALVAIDVDSGQMKWYYQTSPNDTHDWDSAQTPVLADIIFKGKPRKVVMTAARNGYFFVVDRLTGEHLLTSKFSDTANWAEAKLNAKGQPVRIPAKDSDVAGALVSAANAGAANWPPPTFSPDTGLFYVPVSESWAMYYKAELDPRGAMGLGGKDEVPAGGDTYLKAINPATGKIVWSVHYATQGGGSGLLTTAGRLLFAGDAGGNLVARDVATGKPLWHARIGNVSNAAETYMLDGSQYVLSYSGDTLYAFRLNR